MPFVNSRYFCLMKNTSIKKKKKKKKNEVWGQWQLKAAVQCEFQGMFIRVFNEEHT